MSFDKNIFINCPFDQVYRDTLLKPILYILIKNGFFPRISSEISDSGQLRLEKITAIIKSCRYSIHDLSISKSSRAGEFARMNMPFELGIDYGLRNSGLARFRQKQFLILEAVKYDYLKCLSDISGFDIKDHNNETQSVFDCLYGWLSETLKIYKQDPPRKTFHDFLDFNRKLFDEKLQVFKSEELARDYIEKISIPEYIHEIRDRC